MPGLFPAKPRNRRRSRGAERFTRLAAAVMGVMLAVLAGHAALNWPGDPVVSLSRDIPAFLHGAGGPETRAAAVGEFIDGNRMVRSSPAFDFNLIAVAGAFLGASLVFLRPMAAIATALAVTGFAFAAGAFSLHLAGFGFPWSVVALVQVPVALVWGLVSCPVVERICRAGTSPEQAAIRAAFARRLSPRMLERLLEECPYTNPAGRKTEVALMAAVLEDFTAASERIGDPQRIVEILGEYSRRAKEIVFEHDGAIFKNGGDTIFTAWGAPLADDDSAGKAVRTASRLSECDKTAVGGEALTTLVGLHAGEVVVGNIGNAHAADFALIGAVVDLVPRLVGLNRVLGTRILMSDAMHSRMDGGFRTRRVGVFRFKGHGELVMVHELLGPALQEREPEWILKYHQGLAALEEGDTRGALEYFAAANAYRGALGDGPSRFFIDRINSGETLPSGVVPVGP